MPFNYSLPNNVTNFVQVGSYLSDITGQWFGIMIAMSLFAICVISFRDRHIQTNLLATCWVCFLASLFMWAMGWLNFVVLVLFLLATAIMMIWRPKEDYGG